VVGGGGIEADIAYLWRELATMDVALAGFFGLPIPANLPDDLQGLR
jgi:hypothetical protein